MKTASLVLRSALAICFAFVMSSASCDLFDKVDDVTIDVTFDHTFNINESATATNVSYQLKEQLDAAAVSSDFAKYQDKIKSITIKSVTYKISNVATTGIIFSNGSVGYSPIASSSTSQVASLGVEGIDAAAGQVKNLTFNQAGLNELATLLKNDKKANLYITGTLNKTPAKFDVLVTITASVTADALK